LYELTAEPSLWMKRIYEFLGVDNGFSPSFDRLNAVSYPPMLSATKEKLDGYFRNVISRTEEIAGRDMNLRQI
jgi:hypothetical protein